MDRAEVLEALAGALPSDALIVDPDIIRSLSHDEAEWAPVGEPLGLTKRPRVIKSRPAYGFAPGLECRLLHGVPAPGCPVALTRSTAA